MTALAKIDFHAIPVLDVARELFGPEDLKRSNGVEKHFPDHGGLFVNTRKNKWYSHGNSTGGDALDLTQFVEGCDRAAGISWLRSRGYIEQQPSASRVIETYPYLDPTDERNTYYVDRLEPKGFRQWREIDGERVNGIAAGLYERRYPGGPWYRVKDKPNPHAETRTFPAARQVPFLLPKLREHPKRAVVIASGEKDALNVDAVGLIATTNAGGEGNWPPELSQYFKDRKVLILCDDDEQGEKRPDIVGAALSDIAKDIRVVHFRDLNKKGADVSDLIEQLRKEGLDDAAIKETLGERFDNAPEWKPAAKTPTAAEALWPALSEAAYHGPAGSAAKAILPHSEADPAAILIQILVAVGNIIGRSCYFPIEGDRHHPNLFAVVVGESSKARKGTSWGRVRSVVKVVDQAWATDQVKGGLSSGEGFIYEVRDPIKKWNVKDQQEEIVDQGAKDKRLTVIESEFAAALAVMERHGNTLSPLLRKAWDGDKLNTLTRNSPLTATGAHISVIGHITKTELRARLTRTDTASGFANRFLFLLVKRSKTLPFGGSLEDSQIKILGDAIAMAIAELPKDETKVTMSEAAQGAWAKVYDELTGERRGLLGAVTARAGAQVIRLAMVYALLDGKTVIDAVHLRAAAALWEYCEESAGLIFGDLRGDPVSDEILAALKRAGTEGLTRTQIRNLFSGHQSSGSISVALAALFSEGLARMESHGTGGRSTEVWHAR